MTLLQKGVPLTEERIADMIRLLAPATAAGGTASPWLNPVTDFDAQADGSDASEAVNACIAAAVARGDRRITVNDDLTVPSLSETCRNVVAIGRGRLLGSASYDMLVVPADASGPPAPIRTFDLRQACPAFAARIRAGSACQITLLGDSTGGGNVAGPNMASTPQTLIFEAFRRANPGANFTFLPRSIGGTDPSELNSVPDWGSGSPPAWYGSPTDLWLDVVKAEGSHLYVIHMNRNRASTRRFKDVREITEKIRAFPGNPEVIWINTYGQVPETISGRNYIEAGASMTASYGLALGPGVGIIDTSGEETQFRFGHHPGNMPLLTDGRFLPGGARLDAETYLELPYTVPQAAYGFGGNFRLDAGRWTTAGNEIWFQIGNEDIAANLGCRFRIRRAQPSNEIQYKITVTTLADGGAEDWVWKDWTGTGITITNSDTTKFELHRFNHGEIIFNWRLGGSPSTLAHLDNRIFQGFVPSAGGRWQAKIGCAAGTITNALKVAQANDGYSSCLLSLPHRNALVMPKIVDREFASIDDAESPTTPWGGSGPHASDLFGLLLRGVYAAQNFSAW